MAQLPTQMTPSEFKQRWDAGERPLLFDVREQDEWDLCNLAAFGARLIPLAEVPERLAEIPRDQPVVLQCRSGGRSGQAQRFLQAQGYTNTCNLSGGILRWSSEVDPSIPQY